MNIYNVCNSSHTDTSCVFVTCATTVLREPRFSRVEARRSHGRMLSVCGTFVSFECTRRLRKCNRHFHSQRTRQDSQAERVAHYSPVEPTLVDDQTWCAVQCRAQGHCCNDPSSGFNQMISCAQPCMMRASGQSTEAMSTWSLNLLIRLCGLTRQKVADSPFVD